MSDMTIHAVTGAPSPVHTQVQRQEAASSQAPASRSDVIDLSKPPTQEQVERLRSAGILGYGSISAKKSVATAESADGSRVTHFTVDYSFEYFDLVNETVVKHSSSGAGVFTSDGSAAAFQGVTTQTTFDASRYWSGQLGETADRMVASRQAKVSWLEVNFTGKELDSRLSRLDEVYQAAKEEAANSFTQMLGRFLKQNDQGRWENNVRASVLAVFSSYEARYRSVAVNNDQSGWMGASLREATVRLQHLSLSVKGQEEKGPFSLGELDFAAVSVSAFQSSISAAQKGDHQALSFTAAAMKVEAVFARGLIGKDMADMLRQSVESARRELPDATEHDAENGLDVQA